MLSMFIIIKTKLKFMSETIGINLLHVNNNVIYRSTKIKNLFNHPSN